MKPFGSPPAVDTGPGEGCFLIAQQRVFAKQMLAAAAKGQQPAAQAPDAPASAPSTASSANAEPMGPGHHNAPASPPPTAGSANAEPMGPGHGTAPGAG